MTLAWSLTACLRGVHLAAMLSLLGTAGSMAFVLPAVLDSVGGLKRNLIWLWRISGAMALVTGIGWLIMEASDIADTSGVGELISALPIVASQTRFGQVVLLRLALLAVVTFIAYTIRPRLYLALLLTSAAASLEGLIGHAGATEGASGIWLVLSEALHVMAAGVWLGALLPLWLAVQTLPLELAARACERFSPIGLGCVVVLAGSGLIQALALIGGVPALLGTTYGQIAMLKIGLFLLAVILAACNRLWLTDGLTSGITRSRQLLVISIAAEATFGLTIVVAASFLASSVPGIHEPSVWPLPWRVSLTTVIEDADFRQEVIISGLLIGGAVLLVAGALVWRRFRLAALAVLVGVITWRGPSLSLLTVEAYPTSFQTSPTGFAAASIIRGQVLFAANCASCHGAAGMGDGPLAAGLHIKPADLTQPHLWDHSDGEMFWWLSHGIDDPEGGMAMPGFAAALPDEDRWALIDYVRAHQAGFAAKQTGRFDLPLRAPAMTIACNKMPATRMADLAGQMVHVATEQDQEIRPAQLKVPMVSLALAATGATFRVVHDCGAADPAAWRAFAVLADVRPDALAGTQFLIDAKGWLRAVSGPGQADDWRSPAALIAAIQEISTHPINAPDADVHEHHH